MNPSMSIYSIGSSCLPKFGIDKHVGKTHTCFYDWLITDLQSQEKTLVDSSGDRLMSFGWEICDDGIRVRDNHTGIRFQHDFPAGKARKRIPSLGEENLAVVKAKYLRRRERLIDSVLTTVF
jgi:hypothetical protein